MGWKYDRSGILYYLNGCGFSDFLVSRDALLYLPHVLWLYKHRLNACHNVPSAGNYEKTVQFRQQLTLGLNTI